MYQIMLVDDDENVLKALRRVLLSIELFAGEFEVEAYTSPIKALRHAQSGTLDLVISDYRMPMMDGVGFLAALRNSQPDAARIILTGCTDRNIAIDAINDARVARFLTKPWDDNELKSAVRLALTQRQAARELLRTAARIGT